MRERPRTKPVTSLLLACAALAMAEGLDAAGAPLSAGAACATLKRAVTKAYGLPQSTTRTWVCDFAFGFDPTLWVIDLRPNRNCKGHCGGWFAVRKSSGEVGTFDFGNGTMLPLKP